MTWTPVEPTPEDIAAREAEREKAIQDFIACRAAFIQSHMARMGIANHELTARWDQVPHIIQKAMAGKHWGEFGLSGWYGAGKTFALVAALHKHSSRVIDERMTKMVETASINNMVEAISNRSLGLHPWPRWCNWHGEAPARRSQLSRYGPDVEDWIQGLMDPGRLVILDDLGADKAVGQDWTGETLARIVDERLRQNGPTAWTSNLNDVEMAQRYGPRTFSRLEALAPAIQLPKMPDLRQKGGKR